MICCQTYRDTVRSLCAEQFCILVHPALSVLGG